MLFLGRQYYEQMWRKVPFRLCCVHDIGVHQNHVSDGLVQLLSEPIHLQMVCCCPGQCRLVGGFCGSTCFCMLMIKVAVAPCLSITFSAMNFATSVAAPSGSAFCLHVLQGSWQ